MTRLPLAPPYEGPGVPSGHWGMKSPYFRLLANAPRVVPMMFQFAIWVTTSDERLRQLEELAILRICQHTDDAYTWTRHRAVAPERGNLDEKILELANWRDSHAFDERERAVLRCTDEMHETALSDEAFAELENLFSKAEIVELLFAIGMYYGFTRVRQALSPEVDKEYVQYLGGLY